MSFTHRAPFGLAKRATHHFFHLFLLVLFLLPVFAQAQVMPPGPSVCLNGPLPPFQSGNTPSNPGRWSNPDRPGLSWDFTFNNGTLTALWYGFAPPTSTTVAAGEPIWYISNTVQYNSSSWQADLYRAAQSSDGAGGYTAVVVETVGQVAVSFVPGQPEHMAVSWKLNSMNAPVVECIQRLGSDANPNRTLVEQVGPAYSGLWFAPLSSGWGFQALIDLRAGAGGAVEFRESNIVSVYDTSGQPVWLAADGLPNSAWSSMPPPLAVTELPLKYVRATYDVTAPVVSCVSGCTELVPATGVTKFWRGYYNPASGSVGVNVNAQFGSSRAVNFVRPASASAANLLVSEKLTQASNIVASPTNCVPSEINATTCPVAVSWAVLTTGFFGSASALPYMRDLEFPFTETALPANSSGAVVQQLALGRRFQFFLRTSSGQVIAQSSEVRTLSPRLDDPAYDVLQNYSPVVQDTYAGTGGGSGGTSGGQASYSIPIQMAPGRHGMQPSVSLNYSSRVGNGVAGMGWSVSATSSLHRCPKTRDQDGVASVVNFGVEDMLCLDGQRLIAVNGGAYGEVNTEYRTELDGQVKVQQLGGNLDKSLPSTYFVVYRADGMRDFYGARASANGTSSAEAHAQQRLTDNAKPLAWMLRESLDRSNNTVLYSYSTAADGYGSGELLLKQINYTGTLAEVGTRTVEFSYALRPDLSSSGLGGFLSRQTQVLTKIETRTPQGADAVALVRRYNLQYGANPAVIGVSKATGRS